MKMELIDKVLTNMKDYHLPICVLMFLVGSILTWFHHLDMSFVAYTGTILGAITGHAFSPAQKDKDNASSDPSSGK
jgi:hypothetical protein